MLHHVEVRCVGIETCILLWPIAVLQYGYEMIVLLLQLIVMLIFDSSSTALYCNATGTLLARVWDNDKTDYDNVIDLVAC